LPASANATPSFAAFAQTFAHRIVFRQHPAAGADFHQIELSWFRVVDAPVDPRNQKVAVGSGFNDWKARRVFDFV
jgi:hypothetical protein